MAFFPLPIPICLLLLQFAVLNGAQSMDYGIPPAALHWPEGPPRFDQQSAFPPSQTPGPPSARPPLADENERTARMLERAKEFVHRYLTPSDLRHLQHRVARARQNGASRQQIRHVVWHFLADSLTPEQKVELAVEKTKLLADFGQI